MGNSQSDMNHDICDWCVAEDLRSTYGITPEYSVSQAYIDWLRRHGEINRHQAVDIQTRLQGPHCNINDGAYYETPSVPAVSGVEPYPVPRERERDVPRLLSRDRPRTRAQRRQDRRDDRRHMPSRYRSRLRRSNSVDSYLGRVRAWRASEHPRPASMNTSSSNAGSNTGLLFRSRSGRNSNRSRSRHNATPPIGNHTDWKKFPRLRRLWDKIKESSREVKTNTNADIPAGAEIASNEPREKTDSGISPSSTAAAASTPASTPDTPKRRSRWCIRRPRRTSTAEPQEEKKTNDTPPVPTTIPLLPPSAPPPPQTPSIPKRRKWGFLHRPRGIPLLTDECVAGARFWNRC
ncbi:hypothetical protein F5B22DRAFT_647540 [Xylaria bambusicola]|uniref:uncharacterized protein n=1 Tax=Xylaria bambusicola TaxID=326684 RepID=UPI002008AD94|nr:uncharacterized protein F5B22DRAFT_647540 [Xylaria bambusicola]KAI0514501.1 hypothetical protein F5B22DRAFT_647540 [Xylaria bambusicola]